MLNIRNTIPQKVLFVVYRLIITSHFMLYAVDTILQRSLTLYKLLLLVYSAQRYHAIGGMFISY